MNDRRLYLPATATALLHDWTGPVVAAGLVCTSRAPSFGVPPGGRDGRDFAPRPRLCGCGWSTGWLGRTEVHLDLARAEARDRVCRVLGATIGHGWPVGSSAPSWERRVRDDDSVLWALVSGGCSRSYLTHPSQRTTPSDVVVDALGEIPSLLRPDDSPTLQDGSSLVDALALRLVASALLSEAP